MPTVQDILSSKGASVHSTPPDSTVLQAVQKMNQQKIGALLVMENNGGEHVLGMFTERDVLRRVVGELRDPGHVRVGDVMTKDVICCAPDADLDEVSAIMKNRRIRHLPVCGEDGRIRGMISIGDLNAFNASQQEAQIHFLNDYVFGRA
jgi:CBS domain-containing protein